MWPFRKRVKFCDCGTDYCWKPGHMRQLREPPATITTTNDPMAIERAKRQAEWRLRRHIGGEDDAGCM